MEQNETNSVAKFYKCALQVNPDSYISYRGQEHQQSQSQYNQDLLNAAIDANISVIGLADHGSVDSSETLRTLLKDNSITVFPGFEISSSEKIHFVCLFDESRSKLELNRLLGKLDLLDPEDGVHPSTLSATQIIDIVYTNNGFIYAAHCTNENGLLRSGGMNHIWKDPKLLAAQIPGSIEDLKGIEGDSYRKIFLNKIPEYFRPQQMTAINASDVCKPEEISKESASCLVKMTKPTFSSFKQAFHDAESRVRLNSEKSENYSSAIEKIHIIGGYLDGLKLNISENLNAVIGGRGTGKSTLLECIRFALELNPFGDEAQKQHDSVIKENLGADRGTVKLEIRSASMHGRKFTVSRTIGDSAVVRDDQGRVSPHSPKDLLPNLEIYGQNEIYEIIKSDIKRNLIIERFLDGSHEVHDAEIAQKLHNLSENRKSIIKSLDDKSDLESETSRLPKLEDQATQYSKLGLDQKLEIIPKLEKEKQFSESLTTELATFEERVTDLFSSTPSSNTEDNNTDSNLPHNDKITDLEQQSEQFWGKVSEILTSLSDLIKGQRITLEPLQTQLQESIESDYKDIEKLFNKIPASQGKSGKEIGAEYKELLESIERIRPMKRKLEEVENTLRELYESRKDIIDQLSTLRSEKHSTLQRSVKKLNRKLASKIKLTLKPEGERRPLLVFVNNCQLDRVGPAKLKWILDGDFSPALLASKARCGSQALTETNWGITPSVAEAISKLSEPQLLEMEEQSFTDQMEIELNVAHGSEEFRPVDRLSTGQQCTALLHLLLLDNEDPLILDQPEDNLDNAFIADRIVAELRRAKLSRQFLFATHNANIPVFGDAEWIGVFSQEDGKGCIHPENQGAVDLEKVQSLAADILEGGESAFNQRRIKYGFS